MILAWIASLAACIARQTADRCLAGVECVWLLASCCTKPAGTVPGTVAEWPVTDHHWCNAIYLAAAALPGWAVSTAALVSTAIPVLFQSRELFFIVSVCCNVWQVLSAIDIMLPNDIGLGDVYPFTVTSYYHAALWYCSLYYVSCQEERYNTT